MTPSQFSPPPVWRDGDITDYGMFLVGCGCVIAMLIAIGAAA